jgi:2,4-dienoyl-CoA reductase-like NADH-dependent reductase (Old Yellow Enzyme family)
MTDPFLEQVEAYLRESGVTPTALGREALGDPAFVFELRRGREARRATRDRVLSYIAAGCGRSTESGAAA